MDEEIGVTVQVPETPDEQKLGELVDRSLEGKCVEGKCGVCGQGGRWREV